LEVTDQVSPNDNSTKDHTCYNGFAQTVTITMPAVTLPNQVIWSVAYNTSHSGYYPIGGFRFGMP